MLKPVEKTQPEGCGYKNHLKGLSWRNHLVKLHIICIIHLVKLQMKRLIDSILVRWKTQNRRKPLIIRGARQVGKTYSAESFGNQHFDNLVKVDFELERNAHQIFDGDINVDKLLLQLEAACNHRIIPQKTLLFFDEIQECPRALIALRYFYEQMPELHVIAAGSLLEFAVGDISFPVGRVQFEWMHPLGFEEFLRGTGNDTLADNLPALDTEESIQGFIHEKLIEQLRYYFIVGGMPEAVEAFAETSSLAEVTSVHKSLCQSYIQDLAKYTKRLDRDCVEHILHQIPPRVGQRIKYTSLYPEKRIEKIKESLHLLEKVLLFQKVTSSNANGLPLGAEASSKVFKSIFIDIGLMQYLCGISSFTLLNEQNILDVYRGALAEQFVGQELLLHGGSENGKLYYWERPKKSSSAEIDFLFVNNGKIIPIEVKSGNPSRLKSMNLFLSEHKHCKEGLVLCAGNIRREISYRLKFMPLYTKWIENKRDM